MLEHGILHNNAVSQQEAPLKLPRGDAAMQVLPVRIVLLPAADDELVVLGDDIEFGRGRSPATAMEIRNRSVPSSSTVRSML